MQALIETGNRDDDDEARRYGQRLRAGVRALTSVRLLFQSASTNGFCDALGTCEAPPAARRLQSMQCRNQSTALGFIR